MNNIRQIIKTCLIKHLVKHTPVASTKCRVDLFLDECEEQLNPKEKEEMPVMVGLLNRVMGYNGFAELPIGTEVYEYQDRYFFYLEGGIKIKFYKNDLKSAINFISK